MTDTIQLVRVDGDVQHFLIDQPVFEGWVGTVAPIVVEGPPGDYVVVSADDVIECAVGRYGHFVLLDLSGNND